MQSQSLSRRTEDCVTSEDTQSAPKKCCDFLGNGWLGMSQIQPGLVPALSCFNFCSDARESSGPATLSRWRVATHGWSSPRSSQNRIKLRSQFSMQSLHGPTSPMRVSAVPSFGRGSIVSLEIFAVSVAPINNGIQFWCVCVCRPSVWVESLRLDGMCRASIVSLEIFAVFVVAPIISGIQLWCVCACVVPRPRVWVEA